jgi:hypothetical protein
MDVILPRVVVTNVLLWQHPPIGESIDGRVQIILLILATERYTRHIIQVVEQVRSSCAAVATFEHVYVALPLDGASLVPTAVMFVHCYEHAMSTTCVTPHKGQVNSYRWLSKRYRE